jgi:hypothetical protein
MLVGGSREMLSTMEELRPYIESADELYHELARNFALLIEAGHLNEVTQEFKTLCDLGKRYILAKGAVENHQAAVRLALDDEVELTAARLEFVQALYEFDSANHIWFNRATV